MSKEFDQLSGFLNGSQLTQREIGEAEQERVRRENLRLQQEADIARRTKEAAEYKRDFEQKDTLLFNRVISLFREIRDNRLVTWSNQPVFQDEPIYRETFFSGKKVLDHYQQKKIMDYIPARILGSPVKFVELAFNARLHSSINQWTDSDQSFLSHQEICVQIHHGRLEIENPNEYHRGSPRYQEVEESQLVDFLADCMKIKSKEFKEKIGYEEGCGKYLYNEYINLQTSGKNWY